MDGLQIKFKKFCIKRSSAAKLKVVSLIWIEMQMTARWGEAYARRRLVVLPKKNRDREQDYPLA
jgi:hypothetical protein